MVDLFSPSEERQLYALWTDLATGLALCLVVKQYGAAKRLIGIARQVTTKKCGPPPGRTKTSALLVKLIEPQHESDNLLGQYRCLLLAQCLPTVQQVELAKALNVID